MVHANPCPSFHASENTPASEMNHSNQDTLRDLDRVMQKLQEIKKVRTDQQPNQEVNSNPLSLEIHAKMVSSTMRIPNKKYDGTTDPTEHVFYF